MENSMMRNFKKVEADFRDIDSIVKSSRKYWVGESSDLHRDFYESKIESIEDSMINIAKFIKEIEGVEEDSEDTILPSNVL